MRLLVELLAIIGIWIIWDWRAAATLLLILLVVGELQREKARKARQAEAVGVPTLTTPAPGATPGGREKA